MKYDIKNESIITEDGEYELAELKTPNGKSFDILAVLKETADGYEMIDYRYGVTRMSDHEIIAAALEMVAYYEQKNMKGEE